MTIQELVSSLKAKRGIAAEVVSEKSPEGRSYGRLVENGKPWPKETTFAIGPDGNVFDLAFFKTYRDAVVRVRDAVIYANLPPSERRTMGYGPASPVPADKGGHSAYTATIDALDAKLRGGAAAADNKTLPRPTPYLVRQKVAEFEADRECYDTDAAIDLLIKTFPHNTKIEEVLLKVAAINQLYNAGVYTRAIYAVAKLIQGLDVDTKLDQGSIDLVGEIGHSEIEGENHRYVFATKYCHWHRPLVYPIYDDVVADLIWKYQKKHKFDDFLKRDLWSQDYQRYKGIVEKFIDYYGLGPVSFRHLDKFLWRHGRA